MGTETVDIYCGEGVEKTHFRIHKNVLCNKVPFFDKMFNSGFKESTDSMATLPEDDPKAFDVLLEWVYAGALRSIITWNDKEDEAPLHSNYNPSEVYFLAEKLLLPALQDLVIDTTRRESLKQRLLPFLPKLKEQYGRTMKGSGLQRFYAQLVAYLIVSEAKEKSYPSVENLPGVIISSKDLCKDVIAVLAEFKGAVPNPQTGPNCRFHCHGKDEPCPSNMQ